VKTMLEASSSQKSGLIATIGSLAVLLLGATTVFAELQSDLNRIWKCDAARSSGLWGMIRTRLLSFGLIAVIGLLLLIAVVLSAGVSFLANAWLSGFGAAMAHVIEVAGVTLI